jgi:hypothetical protein
MKFIHVSTEPNFILNKDTFKVPYLSNHSYGWHNFNLDNALYLASVYKKDNEDTCMWLERNDYFYKYVKDYKSIRDYANGTKFYFDVEFEKDKIYVIDTIDDLIKFIVNYSYFGQQLDKPIDDEDKMLDIMRKKFVIDNFIFNLSKDDQKRINGSNIPAAIKSRDLRNLPLVEIKKNQVVIPKKGIGFEFLVDVLRTKEYYTNYIGNTSYENISTTIHSIKYSKLVKEGYNGVYYTSNLVKFKTHEEIINSLEYYEKNNLVFDKDYDQFELVYQKPDLSKLPNFIPLCSEEDRLNIIKDFEEYIQWLCTDTLMLWKWIW